jgi:serine protease Do
VASPLTLDGGNVSKRNSIIVGMVVMLVAMAIVAIAGHDTIAPRVAAQSETETVTAGGPLGTIGFDTFREVAKAQMPMVVNIRTESRRQTRELSGFFDNDLLERFLGQPDRPHQPREQMAQSAGTGFIIDKSGLILTNNQVVAGANKIAVALYAEADGEEYDARVVGRDPLTDSALIELTEKPSHALPVAALGNSNDAQPGDWVMAIGNPFNLAHTVTVGVISAVGRPFPVAEGRWQDVLQTDAAINPGNSGGPLLNMRGEVIGINSAILSGGPVAGNVGVGFAIPISPVRDLLPQLRQGTVTRGRIGVQIAPVTKDIAQPLGLKESRGALVRLVERGGPAAAAGIQPGDVIVRYNDQYIDKSDTLVERVTGTKPGTAVPVELIRDGKRQTVRVTVGTLDLDEQERTGETLSDTGFGLSLRALSPKMRNQLDVPLGRGGAVVMGVDAGGPAARSGVRAGDVVLEVNRTPVNTVADATTALRRVPENDPAFMLVWRQGQEVFLTMSRQ